MKPAEIKQMLDTRDNVILLDVRDPQEYAQGFIPGAMLLPLHSILGAHSMQDLDAMGLQELAAQKGLARAADAPAIIVYCHSGVRSAQAARKLAALGFENVIDGGGIIDWPYGLQMPAR